MLTHPSSQAEPVREYPPGYTFNLTLVFPKRSTSALQALREKAILLYSPDWPRTLGEPPASGSPVQGITGTYHHAQRKGNIYLCEAELIKNLTPEKPSTVTSNIGLLFRTPALQSLKTELTKR